MPTPPTAPAVRRSRGGALAVAAGILLSRLAGLLRERAIAHYLGISAAADAFRAALRVPNLLQNLLGEGVLSASFIPVYARLLAQERFAEASLVARAVGSLLALAASALAVLGVWAAGPLVNVLSPGFDAPTLALTTALVQILFPGVALLVLSAWCLGVLNSHRRFFLSYASPVLWNTALIAAVIAAGARFWGEDATIATWLAWGAVVGSAAQFLVQLPAVLRLLGSVRPVLAVDAPGVRDTLRAFGPVLLGRGSVQLSGYIDQILASYLGQGVVAALANAQTLYLLPVSLFGMAVSAAELPELSAAAAQGEARSTQLHARLASALRRVVFLVVPSAVAFVTIGGFIVQLLFESGRFGSAATQLVWLLLAGSAIGLTAGTQGRLLASAFYALGQPQAPLRASLVRVSLTALAGWAVALPLRAAFGYDARWAAFGLTCSSALAAWLEYALLRKQLDPHVGGVPVPLRLGLGALACALGAGVVAQLAGQACRSLPWPRWLDAVCAIVVFGVLYLGGMSLSRVPEALRFVAPVARRLKLR